MPKLTPVEIDIAGRVTALTYVMEIMLANETATWPDDGFEHFVQDARSRPSTLASGPVDVDVMQAIDASTEAHLSHFFDRVAQRRRSIINPRR